jgi:hypothetical protein
MLDRRIDDDMEGLVFTTTQDVEPILDNNKALYNDGSRGYTPSRDLRHIAEIPLVIVEKWKNDYGVDCFNKDHAEGVRRLLNSNEFLYLRTAPGRV